MDMKVLLVFPGWGFGATGEWTLPLGLAYIGGVLKDRYDVQALDLRLLKNWDEFKSRLEQLKPDVVGISCDTVTFNRAAKIAEIVKKCFPECFVVMGGPHPTILPEETLKATYADAAVVGEGEYTFLDLLNNLEEGKLPSEVNGVQFKDGSGKIHANSPREPIKNLDELPFPARELFPVEKYAHSFESFPLAPPGLNIISSRGCVFNCSFCQPTLRKLFGTRVRYRNPTNVVSEMKFLIEKYKLRSLAFTDDTLTVNRKWVLDFCQLIRKESIDVDWWCYSRANTINKDMLEEMKKAGCRVVCFGIESGSDRILKDILNKGVTTEANRRAVRLCKEVGITCEVNIMIGNPTETLDDLLQTMHLLNETNPERVIVNITSPIPGTHLFEYAQRNGILLAREFEDYDRSWGFRKLKLEYLSEKELILWRFKLSRCFFSFKLLREEYYSQLCLKRWLSLIKIGRSATVLKDIFLGVRHDIGARLLKSNLNIVRSFAENQVLAKYAH